MAAAYSTSAHRITKPTGTERVFVDNGSRVETWLSVEQIAQLGAEQGAKLAAEQAAKLAAAQSAQLSILAAKVYNTSALAAAGTLTASDVMGGSDTVFLGMTGAFTEAASIELPMVASVIAALSASQGAGSTYVLRVINPSAEALTITENAGWTLGSGSYVLATKSFRDFLVTIVSDTAATLQDVGAGANNPE